MAASGGFVTAGTPTFGGCGTPAASVPTFGGCGTPAASAPTFGFGTPAAAAALGGAAGGAATSKAALSGAKQPAAVGGAAASGTPTAATRGKTAGTLPTLSTTSLKPHQQRRTAFTYVNEDAISREFKCAVCLDPFVDPVDVSCCRATFCTKCCEAISACPMCRSSTATMTPSSRLVRNTVDALLVECDGCHEILQREHFALHASARCMASTRPEALPFIVARLREQLRELQCKHASELLQPCRQFVAVAPTFVRRTDSIVEIRGSLATAPRFTPKPDTSSCASFGGTATTIDVPLEAFEEHEYTTIRQDPRGFDFQPKHQYQLLPITLFVLPEMFRPSASIETNVNRRVRATATICPDGRVILDSVSVNHLFWPSNTRSKAYQACPTFGGQTSIPQVSLPLRVRITFVA